MRLAIGDPAPDFTVLNHDSTATSLQDFRGHPIVLYIFPKADTPGCTLEATDFQHELPRFNAHDIVVMGLSPDPPEVLRVFRSKYGLDFTMLSDPDLKTVKAYGAYGTKKLYGKEITGLLRSTFVISPEGTIEQALYNVKATGHCKRIARLVKLD
jgi:peroxiredoxin Q/BCP